MFKTTTRQVVTPAIDNEKMTLAMFGDGRFGYKAKQKLLTKQHE
jgi:hypothetical protein